MPDPTKINKTIRKIRKENHDEDKINKKDNPTKDKVLRDKRALFESDEDDYWEPIKTSNAINSNYIEYESNGDKSKSLLIKEYLNKIKPYI